MYRQLTTLIISGGILAGTLNLNAGPYSPGKGGIDEIGFIDAGIAGFVGPAGDGVAPTETNGNYLNPIFKGWATGWVAYQPSDQIGFYGQNGIPTNYGGGNPSDPSQALSPVTGNVMDVVCLGDMDATELAAYHNNPTTAPSAPGYITLTFDRPIFNGDGADFAVFENGFVSGYSTGAGSVAGQMFAELAYVEVSTDGITFARFPAEYLNPTPTGSTAYLTQDVSNIYNLAGKHANAYSASWGTPFNLDDLLDNEYVLDGTINLGEINFVRIVDIPGDGSFTDSAGNPIYDAWVTWGTGGFDLEAVGVINQIAAVPEPSTWLLLSLGFVGLIFIRSRKTQPKQTICTKK